MTWLQIIVLAAVQGLTEFLPVSSSGHLILVPAFFGWSDQGLVFDIAVHFGSLGAVCLYFRKDVAGLLRGGGDILTGRGGSDQARMAWCIGIGTIPAVIAGLLLAGWIAVYSAIAECGTTSTRTPSSRGDQLRMLFWPSAQCSCRLRSSWTRLLRCRSPIS